MMFGYIVKRILQLIPVLIGISFITFLLSFIVPGDPVRTIMGQRSDREIELRIRRKFGLDKPWYIQYAIWTRNLVRNPGSLPQCKLRLEDNTVYLFDLERDTVLATNGVLREVVHEPYQRRVLTHLLQDDCPDTSRRPEGIESTQRFVSFETLDNGTRATLRDFTGGTENFFVDPDCFVCTSDETGWIDVAVPEEQYTAYFRKEGYLTGRTFNAVFDVVETRVIDGMYDEASIGNSELRQLDEPMIRTIAAREHRQSDWYFELRDENGGVEEFEMMPNAVLMLGGNRSIVGDYVPGLEVNIAFTIRKDTTLYALYDDESAGLTEVTNVLGEHPDSLVASGTLSDIVLSPAVWFDFGRSYWQHREVREIIADSFRNTAYLSLVAMIIAILVGVGAGIVSAVKPYSVLDYFTMTVALIGVSMPVFWLGLMLILLFQSQLHLIKGVGYGEIEWYAINLGLFSVHLPWHQQVILPAVTLATVPMAIIARMTRSSMLEVMNLDYIRTARAKGLTEWSVIIRHALKNALIPIITVIGVNFALLLAGAVLTETVFSWPGLGREIVDAIEFRDFPVVMAGVVLFAFVFVMVNLIVDILYAYIDPRIRYQ